MAGMSRQSFAQSQDVRPFVGDTGQLEVVDVGGASLGRATFKPGWRWSEHVRPLAGTDSCEAAHAGYVIAGRLVVRMDDGQEEEFGPGDVMAVEPGHDAWVVGDESCVVVDWQGYRDYAKPTATATTSGRQ